MSADDRVERATSVLDVDIVRAESPKFRRPLLLVHGLWTDRWLWQPLGSYFSHRGWESWIARVPEPRRADLTTLEAATESLARRCPAVPVLLAHGTAAFVAARVAARVGAPALVLVAPVLPPSESPALAAIFRWPQLLPARIGGAKVPPPRGRARTAFVGDRVHADPALVADSGRLFRELASAREPLPTSAIPTAIVVSGGRDVVSPASAGAELAARHGWQHVVVSDGGHLAILEPGWERIADDLHRWLVRALGADLLAFLDEEEEEE